MNLNPNLKCSCGPQPSPDVPSSQSPQLLPATYVHCRMHCSHTRSKGSLKNSSVPELTLWDIFWLFFS